MVESDYQNMSLTATGVLWTLLQSNRCRRRADHRWPPRFTRKPSIPEGCSHGPYVTPLYFSFTHPYERSVSNTKCGCGATAAVGLAGLSACETGVLDPKRSPVCRNHISAKLSLEVV